MQGHFGLNVCFFDYVGSKLLLEMARMVDRFLGLVPDACGDDWVSGIEANRLISGDFFMRFYRR